MFCKKRKPSQRVQPPKCLVKPLNMSGDQSFFFVLQKKKSISARANRRNAFLFKFSSITVPTAEMIYNNIIKSFLDLSAIFKIQNASQRLREAVPTAEMNWFPINRAPPPSFLRDLPLVLPHFLSFSSNFSRFLQINFQSTF